MKYLFIALFVLATWVLVDYLLLHPGSSRASRSLGDRLGELGGRIHSTVGIIACIIVIMYLARLIVRALTMP